MASEPRACPVTPEELRAYAAHTEDWSVTTADKLRDLADWLATPAAASDTIESYFVRQSEWSAKTFGQGTRTLGIIEHIRKELDEVAANPHDLEEWIDLTMLSMDGFWRHGGDPRTILEHLNTKLAKNFARKWNVPKDDHSVEHVREDAAASEPTCVCGPTYDNYYPVHCPQPASPAAPDARVLTREQYDAIFKIARWIDITVAKKQFAARLRELGIEVEGA